MAFLPPSPRSIRAVALVTVVQVLLVVIAALVEMFSPDGSFRDPGLHIFWLVVTLLAVLASWQLMRGRPWARSVLVTWHLLLIFSFISISGVIGLSAWVGLGMSVLAIILFILPSSRRFIEDERARIFDD